MEPMSIIKVYQPKIVKDYMNGLSINKTFNVAKEDENLKTSTKEES